MAEDGLRSWYMDSRLQGGASLLERISRIDLCTHDGHVRMGLRTGPPTPWSTSPHSGMRGVSQHRDGQHEPARPVVCLVKHAFRKCADETFGFVLETFSGFVTPSPGPAAAAAGRILLERYRVVDVGRGRADRQEHLDAAGVARRRGGGDLDGASGQERRRTSSLHARGAPDLDDPLVGVHGIIPACAGSTRSTPRSPPPRRDHPRMRGEHDACS